MKEILATITERGQVTVPAEVRRILGVKPREKIAFAIENGQVRLVPASFTLESAYGSVKPLKRPEDLDEIIREVKAERANRTRGKASDQ
ncbi:MAG TPA: type II toxin-antitoxin system PrlF family antitoxin [Chloroflexota bacterium]|nr:type II toxin-antitoxin system PrlF family antitoxin [Chloroflexota bacterium]